VIRGAWYGQLAERWGLAGNVREDQFERLADGQHPITGEQLVRHQTARDTKNARGETVTTMEHRAGWEATFSAPKTVSLTALVGGDRRVREAHEASVDVALGELERYVQARLGGNRPAETTRNWVAAKFAHDSARPVNGYARPSSTPTRSSSTSRRRPTAKCVHCSRASCTGRSSTRRRCTDLSWRRD